MKPENQVRTIDGDRRIGHCEDSDRRSGDRRRANTGFGGSLNRLSRSQAAMLMPHLTLEQLIVDPEYLATVTEQAVECFGAGTFIKSISIINDEVHVDYGRP